MTTAIFIKTWINDLPWLKHCVASIQKHASGFSEYVIVADEDCLGKMEFVPPNFRIEYVPKWPRGYIQQQWYKITANTFTEADQILFVDSDCVFFAAFSPETYMRDGKPVLLRTRYGSLGTDHVSLVAEKWKQISEKFLGFSVEWEYMRRMPILLLSSTLSEFLIEHQDTEKRLREFQTDKFSEFNVLGPVVERKQPGAYVFQDTAEFLPDAICRQFWSWGGFTKEVEEEMRSFNAT